MPLSRPWRTRVLLIGTSSFRAKGQRELPQVKADLVAVGDALTDPRTGVADHKRLTLLHNPQAAEALAAARQRRWRPTDDLLIVYYSGHGILHPQDFSLWLTTHDSDFQAGDEHLGLAYRRLAETLRNRGNARRVVVILDCCYSGNALKDVPDAAGYYVLTSVQKNRRTPQPAGGSLSPYTEVLVDVLRNGDAESTQGLMVGHLADVLADRFHHRFIRQGRRTREVRGEHLDPLEQETLRWKPQHSLSDGSAIVSRPFGQPVPRRPGPAVQLAEAAAYRLRRAGEAAAARWRRLLARAPKVPRQLWTALATVLALALVAAGTTVAVHLAAGQAACAPPLELRVLASTENRAALTSAADAFEQSPGNHASLGAGDSDPSGCRRINVSVASAPENQVVSAFAAAGAWSSGVAELNAADCGSATPPAGSLVSSCPAPLRDVGPQPDVWIPDSSAELTLAQQAVRQSSGTVVLSGAGSVASSAVAVGVSQAVAQRLAEQGVPADAPWQRLLPALLSLDRQVLHASPAGSGAGLLELAGVYLDWSGTLGGGQIPGADAGLLEHSAADAGASASDTESLLCDVQQQAQPGASDPYDGVVVLASDKALADLAQARLQGPSCGVQAQGGTQLVALHPAGAPALDLPYVTVRWPGTQDQAKRDAAAERFRAFLLGADGRAVLGGQGYAAPRDAAPLSAGQLTGVLRTYTAARQPAQLLFLLDVSGSMADNRKLPTAVAALQQGLSGLGPKDGYGIWTVPRSVDAPLDTGDLVPLGTSDPLRGRQALAGVRVLQQGAGLYEAIGAAAQALRRQAGPRLLVVVTDGDDRPLGGDAMPPWQAALAALTGDAKVQLDVVGMDPAVCDAGSSITALVRLVGGRCVSAGSGLGEQLAGMVATAGEGGAQ